MSSDAIQLSYPLLPTSAPALSPSNVFWTLESGSFLMSQLFTSGGQSIPLKCSNTNEVKATQSCPTLCYPMDCSPWNSPGRNTGVGRCPLLQGIFPTQGSNPGFPHCGKIFYQLSHKGSPRILEWVAYPFSGGSSWPRNWIGVFCIAGGFLTNWAICCTINITLIMVLLTWYKEALKKRKIL